MKEQDIYAEISSIKNLMERSTKFISLSGFSGILAGIYALIGAGLTYSLVYNGPGVSDYSDIYLTDPRTSWQLLIIGVVVLTLSISTGILLTIRKARRKGNSVWNPVSRKLLEAMLIPLLTGGLLVLIMLSQEWYATISAACLIFYGLALVGASQFTFNDVKWLGLFEITLGLIAAAFPAYGLIFWTIGFGVLHIVYGSIMYFKYDK